MWWVDHDTVIQEAGHFSRAGKGDTGLERAFPSVQHFLIVDRPWFHVYWPDDENLERVEALKWGFVWILRGNVGRELHKTTKLFLVFSEL